MFGFARKKTLSRASDYAAEPDFCAALLSQTQSLYLLGLLITGTQRDAERCFVATVEECSEKQGVYREFIAFWVRRCLVRNALTLISARPAENDQAQPGSKHERANDREELLALMRLGTMERLVFVLNVLERNSLRECSLLLNCTTEAAIDARVNAFRNLAAMRSRTEHWLQLLKAGT